MAKYLDHDGLSHFWTKIVEYVSGKSTPIELVESTDSSSKVPLRGLASGTYILKGYFTSYEGGTQSYTFSTGMLVAVVRQTSMSYVQIFYPKSNTIQYLEISDDSVMRQDAKLINMESVANMVTQVNELSDDSHYPSAKAVYDAIISVLTEAQESGEFDGVSATHSWDGTILTVTSASGTSSADLKGAKGDDYILTEADKSEIAEQTLKEISVTPQMYGAMGDGENDDTQALFDALTENDEVFLPKGEYVITQPIDLTDGKKLYSHNREGVIRYKGSDSVFLLGRRTRVNGIKVLVDSTTVSKVFNTDNRIFSASSGGLMTDVDDIEVYFNYIADSLKTTLIHIVASNKDYLGVSGFHNQSYSNIVVAGNGRIEYGIKICVSFDDPYEEDVIGALPWITNLRFNHIWLGSPETGIKVHRENNSGTDVDYPSIVRTENMMFTDIATQDTNDEHTKKFYDVEWCIAEFINCQPWDYHHVLNRGEKYNTIGAGAWISEVNARRSPIAVAEFPSVTAITPEEDPAYFIKTFFNFISVIQSGDYDYIDMKCEEHIGKSGFDEVRAEAVAQRTAYNIALNDYTNVMEDPLTEVRVNQRFSGTSNIWTDCSANDALIIPIKEGTNLIRFAGNVLSNSYASVFLSNDLESCVRVDEQFNITETVDGDCYLPIDNKVGYTYAILPFVHTDVTMNAENMIVTINELICDGLLKQEKEHIADADVHVTVLEKETWNAKSNFSGNYADLTDTPTSLPASDVYDWAKQASKPTYTADEVGALSKDNTIPTKTSQLTNDSGFLTEHQDISGKADKSTAESWTFTLSDGSVVTKKVVLA